MYEVPTGLQTKVLGCRKVRNTATKPIKVVWPQREASQHVCCTNIPVELGVQHSMGMDDTARRSCVLDALPSLLFCLDVTIVKLLAVLLFQSCLGLGLRLCCGRCLRDSLFEQPRLLFRKP